MIYLVADIHGHIRLNWLKTLLDEKDLSSNDLLIILGDAGIVWSQDASKNVQEYYNSLPCKVLFLDGNHENFDLLETFPIVDLFAGKARKVSDNIYHLMRGEIYTICGKSFFVFGGGFSAKKLTQTSPVYIWNREMPSEEEYANGIRNLQKNNCQIDYIISHVAPSMIAKKMGIKILDEEKILNDYLEEIRKKVPYKWWYFGHYHIDMDVENSSCLFERILSLGE